MMPGIRTGHRVETHIRPGSMDDSALFRVATITKYRFAELLRSRRPGNQLLKSFNSRIIDPHRKTIRTISSQGFWYSKVRTQCCGSVKEKGLPPLIIFNGKNLCCPKCSLQRTLILNGRKQLSFTIIHGINMQQI